MRREWKRWRKGQSCSYGAVMRWAGVMRSELPYTGPLACYSSNSDDFSAAGELWWPWHTFTVLTTVQEQEETWRKALTGKTFIQYQSSWHVTDSFANGPHSEDCWTSYSKGHTDIKNKKRSWLGIRYTLQKFGNAFIQQRCHQNIQLNIEESLKKSHGFYKNITKHNRFQDWCTKSAY